MRHEFDHRHYVPTIRWKRGERVAFRSLAPAVRSQLTPLIELPPSRFNLRKKESKLNIDGRIAEFATEFESCLGDSPFFLDFGLLSQNLKRTSTGSHILTEILSHARDRKLGMIPVTGLRRMQDHYIAIAIYLNRLGDDICIRISLNNIQFTQLQESISELLAQIGVSPGQVHLVIDSGYSKSNSVTPANIINMIDSIGPWKTITLSCGAFPTDLSSLNKNEIHQLQRLEWIAWKSLLIDNPQQLMRKPTYGDCTIRHPIFSEPPPFANTSASIRYTSDDYWLVLRGEALRKSGGAGHNQYFGLAGVLVTLPEYMGPSYCEGDKYINEVAKQNVGPGTPETWLRAGFNHHMTFVVNQIASLSEI